MLKGAFFDGTLTLNKANGNNITISIDVGSGNTLEIKYTLLPFKIGIDAESSSGSRDHIISISDGSSHSWSVGSNVSIHSSQTRNGTFSSPSGSSSRYIGTIDLSPAFSVSNPGRTTVQINFQSLFGYNYSHVLIGENGSSLTTGGAIRNVVMNVTSSSFTCTGYVNCNSNVLYGSSWSGSNALVTLYPLISDPTS